MYDLYKKFTCKGKKKNYVLFEMTKNKQKKPGE